MWIGWSMRSGRASTTSYRFGPRTARAVRNLPHYHRDPFDRLLVAQAWCEPLLLVTADGNLAQYGSSRILTV